MASDSTGRELGKSREGVVGADREPLGSDSSLPARGLACLPILWHVDQPSDADNERI
jgi:hypothetical protein